MIAIRHDRFQHELKIISQQYPFEPIKYLRPSLRITFQEGIAMLRVSRTQLYCILMRCTWPHLYLTVSPRIVPRCPVLDCSVPYRTALFCTLFTALYHNILCCAVPSDTHNRYESKTSPCDSRPFKLEIKPYVVRAALLLPDESCAVSLFPSLLTWITSQPF